MNRITLLRAAAILATIAAAGCAQTTPDWESRFGQNARMTVAQQTLNPDAVTMQASEAADGQAVREGVVRYRQTFKEPPPPQNVFNIGVGSSAGGASGGR